MSKPPRPQPSSFRLRGRTQEGDTAARLVRPRSGRRRARLSAFHRGSRHGECSSPRLGVRPCFLGLGRSVRSCDRQSGRGPNAAPGRYPGRNTCPSPASTSRTGPSAGRMMPKPPECDSDEPPPAGTALAPPAAVQATSVPSRERDSRPLVSKSEAEVKYRLRYSNTGYVTFRYVCYIIP